MILPGCQAKCCAKISHSARIGSTFACIKSISRMRFYSACSFKLVFPPQATGTTFISSERPVGPAKIGQYLVEYIVVAPASETATSISDGLILRPIIQPAWPRTRQVHRRLGVLLPLLPVFKHQTDVITRTRRQRDWQRDYLPSTGTSPGPFCWPHSTGDSPPRIDGAPSRPYTSSTPPHARRVEKLRQACPRPRAAKNKRAFFLRSG